MNDINMYENIVVRRKAKRIERASLLLDDLRLELDDYNVPETDKDKLISSINRISKYLVNNDKSENKFNFDNYNG